MKIAVLGLGFVGTTSMLGFSSLGFKVTGIEKNIERLNGFKENKIPFYDKELQIKFESSSDINFISHPKELSDDIKDILVCVETPFVESKLDLSIVKAAIRSICEHGKSKNIWLRSTIDNPEEIIAFQKEVNKSDNNLYLYPEFMREGNCWEDFFDPAFTILAGENVIQTEFYQNISKNFKDINCCNIPEAITVKIASNAFHALKVTFANELKYLKYADQIDIENVMRIFCTDKKLNISSKYLSPGEPYSGPCLKKDTLALSNLLSESIKDISLINQIDISNETQIDLIINEIESMQDENIGFYGLEFKKGSGDIRNSYMIKLIKRVKNKNIFIFDESVSQRELKNVLGSEFKIEKSLQEMADKVDLVFTKFDTSLKINKKVISLSSL